MIMEICIDSYESAINAIEGGATRIEACSALSEGGLTPSPGLLKLIKGVYPKTSLYAMLRIRAGNFVYTKEEISCMLHDLEIMKQHGANGIVFGALTPKNEIDVETCERILSASRPLPVTFHRAFDEVDDPQTSLNTLLDLGFERILTSGQRNTAEEGLALIRALVVEAANRIVIMPGSGITKENIRQIRDATGANEFHASGKKKRYYSSGANRVKIGSDATSNYIIVTDKDEVREMVEIISSGNNT